MPEGIEFTTDRLPPKERFESWRQFGIESAGIVIAQDADDGRAAFSGAVSFQFKGSLARFSTRSDSTRVTRGPGEISRHAKGCYFIYRERGEGAHYSVRGRDFTTRRGSVVIGDVDQPFATRPIEGARFRHDIVYLPKALLDPYLPRVIGPLARPLSERPGVGGVAASAVAAFWREWDEISDSAMLLAADTLCRLVGLAFGADAGDHAEAVRSGRLTQARRFVDRHLTDPQLSAARAAAALRISERTLHALFESTGTTFAAHVRQRRLEECRAAALACPSRPIMDIALAWGFGSMPSFYRAFQAAFGLTPGEMREAAAQGHRPGDRGN